MMNQISFEDAQQQVHTRVRTRRRWPRCANPATPPCSASVILWSRKCPTLGSATGSPAPRRGALICSASGKDRCAHLPWADVGRPSRPRDVARPLWARHL